MLKIQPINFNLKSENEKEVVLNNYRQFLKICNFDFQIIVRTRKENTKSHVDYIYQKENIPKHVKEEYCNYITELTNSNYIYLKSFYLIYSIKQENTNDLIKIGKELSGKYSLIKECLEKCGNDVYDLSEYDDEKLCKLISNFINEKESLYEFY